MNSIKFQKDFVYATGQDNIISHDENVQGFFAWNGLKKRIAC